MRLVLSLTAALLLLAWLFIESPFEPRRPRFCVHPRWRQRLRGGLYAAIDTRFEGGPRDPDVLQ